MILIWRLLFFAATIDPAATVAIIAAGVGPIGAYFIAARRMSGKIGNSDAEQLWQESRAIRDWSTERIDAYVKEIHDLREELADLTSRYAALESEKRSIAEDLATARERIQELIELVSRKGKSHQ